MVKIDYLVAAGDLAAFHEHFAWHSGAVNVRRVAAVQALATGGAVFFSILLFSGSAVAAGVVGLLVGGLVFLAWPSVHRSQLKKSIPKLINKLYSASGADGVLGNHSVELSPDGLTERTSVNETRQKWVGVRSVDVTKEHVYIFTTPTMAFVIPRSAIAAFDEFLRSVTEYAGAAKIRRFDGAAA